MPSARAKSAGLLAWRHAAGGGLEVFLVHPGGPFWAHKDAGAWTIPKGLVNPGEDPADTARREFTEETGCTAGGATLVSLGDARQKSGKVIVVWAFEGDCDADAVVSNTFELEWPRGRRNGTDVVEHRPDLRARRPDRIQSALERLVERD